MAIVTKPDGNALAIQDVAGRRSCGSQNAVASDNSGLNVTHLRENHLRYSL
ncbi:hypothetical protein [Erwinia sp. 198]|uniref:hypothetical protein n=1 Tax=Erwinia sp. 198 TaxID=2022746 RepID=UPI0013151097|nr:hypothetical protein [Erwinia sp. 198]